MVVQKCVLGSTGGAYADLFGLSAGELSGKSYIISKSLRKLVERS